MSNDSIERTLGAILATQENTNGWLRSIDGKLDKHVETPHADVDDVKANTRWRWSLAGVVALLTAVGSVLAYFG